MKNAKWAKSETDWGFFLERPRHSNPSFLKIHFVVWLSAVWAASFQGLYEVFGTYMNLGLYEVHWDFQKLESFDVQSTFSTGGDWKMRTWGDSSECMWSRFLGWAGQQCAHGPSPAFTVPRLPARLLRRCCSEIQWEQNQCLMLILLKL